MISVKVFLPTANKSHASVIGLTAAITLLPAMLVGLSAYISSKLALVKVLEFLAIENPNLFVAALNPGMVETAVFAKSGGKAESLPMDTGQYTTYSNHLVPIYLFISPLSVGNFVIFATYLTSVYTAICEHIHKNH
jgi:short-subunit dehydrogenase